MRSIPVANIYFLLCYAWDQFEPDTLNRVATEEASDILELFSRLLAKGVRVLHKRGFETDYTEREQVTSTLRGRVLIGASIKARPSFARKVVCLHDELTSNVLRNQILKSTLIRILGCPNLRNALRRELADAIALLRETDAIRLTNRLFYEAQSRNGNRLYAFLMNVSHFLFESLQPCETAGTTRFVSVFREPERMRRIFEKFVRNFLAGRQSAYPKVAAERLSWSATPIGDSDLRWLPSMMTDVTLRSPDRTVVIECKYTPSPLQSGRFETERLQSSHLYQLCTYLRALEARGGADASADGILLYPAAGVSFDEAFLLHGHLVRIKTLDLCQLWPEIERDLLSVLPGVCVGSSQLTF